MNARYLAPILLSLWLFAPLASAQEFLEECLLPDLEIPDLESVSSEIEVTEIGEIQEMSVSIDISHVFVGDLTVAVYSPADTEVVLHAEDGFASNDLIATFTDEGRDNGFPYDCDCAMLPSGPGLMEDYEGELVQGTWVLECTDSVASNSGTLNEWCLRGDYSTIRFLRGDANGNAEVQGLADALFILEWVFSLGDEPGCEDAADVDDSGTIQALTEAVALLSWFFLDDVAPPDPGVEECDEDPTSDDIGCDEYECP